MDSMIYFVEDCGMWFTIKYLTQPFWMTPDSVDTQLVHWDANQTSLKEALTRDIATLRARYSNDNVYCVQCFRLPFKCETTLSSGYGKKAFMMMYEHSDPRFRSATQCYYTFNVNLVAVEKPRKVNDFVAFFKSISTVKRNAA